LIDLNLKVNKRKIKSGKVTPSYFFGLFLQQLDKKKTGTGV
jgi:hypothetical protein